MRSRSITPLKPRLGSDRQRQHHRLQLELAQRRDGGLEIGVLAVEPVHEGERRNAEALAGAPHARGADLRAPDRRAHEHGAVERVERDLAVGLEVRVAGRVDERHVPGAEVEAVDRSS